MIPEAVEEVKVKPPTPPPVAKVSSFVKKASSNPIQAWENEVPLNNFDVWKIFQQLLEARDPKFGGDIKDVSIASIIAACSEGYKPGE